VLRIARARDSRAGRGRTPDDLKRWTRLDATAIEAGSSVLVIEAPGLEEQRLPLFDDPGISALRVFEDALEAIGRNEPPPAELNDLSEQTIRGLLGDLGGYDRVEWTRISDGIHRAVAVTPQILETTPAEAEEETRSEETIVGRLYQLNLRRHTYGIEDNLGQAIHCEFPEDFDYLETIRPLVGREVEVRGIAHRDRAGRIRRFTVDRIGPSRTVDATGDFFTYDLAAAIAATEPITDIESLRLDLTTDEADRFWRALTE
jgi:hypothetical protein